MSYLDKDVKEYRDQLVRKLHKERLLQQMRLTEFLTGKREIKFLGFLGYLKQQKQDKQ